MEIEKLPRKVLGDSLQSLIINFSFGTEFLGSAPVLKCILKSKDDLTRILIALE